MPEVGVSCRAAGSTVRRGPFLGTSYGVLAGQAGLLAMVMIAGAMRGGGVLRGGVREGGRGLGLAGAAPAAVEGIPVAPDFPGHGLVAGVPEADRGQDSPEGAGEGQVTGPDGEAGSLSLPRGRGREGG